MNKPVHLRLCIPVWNRVGCFSSLFLVVQLNCKIFLLNFDVMVITLQDTLENFDGASKGKYTIGLGQDCMAFCSEVEDVISMGYVPISQGSINSFNFMIIGSGSINSIIMIYMHGIIRKVLGVIFCHSY